MALRTSRFGQQFLGCTGYPDCKTILSLNAISELEQNSEQQPTNQPETLEDKCEKCGGGLILKTGPYGKYTECLECKDRKPFRKSTGVKCPKCDEGTIIEKKSKKGIIFYGCNKYPNCDFTLWNEPTGNVCPECGALLVKKASKKGTVISCSNKECLHKPEIIPNENDNESEGATQDA